MAKPIPTFTIKAELSDFDAPKTWRRFKIKKNLPITELAYYLEIMFEMYAEHLYDFTYDLAGDPVVMVDDPARYNDFPSFPGARQIDYIALDDFRLNYLNVGDKFTFHYDFGDGWKIKLTIEDLDTQNELSAKNLPRIIEGQGFGIIENIGGTGSLTELSKELKTSKDQWSDFSMVVPEPLFDVLGGFSLDYYNQDELNWRLKRLVRYYRQAYAGVHISEHAIAMLERQYPEFK